MRTQQRYEMTFDFHPEADAECRGAAIHLALSAGDDAFATFDKALGKVAEQNGIAPQVQVLKR